MLFIIKFNGACLRPPVPRPITGNKGMQLKFVDDSTQAASVNLKKSLEPDLTVRPRPLKYNERTQMKTKDEENVLQLELEKFQKFCTQNKLVINSRKCFSMVFNRSKLYAFPPEFKIGDSELLNVKKTHRILGVLIQDDLKFGAQVKEMVRRATTTTWVIRRMRALGVDQATLLTYWKAEGRVHLEMACPVWSSSLTIAQSQDLERAQRVAMAAIAGRWEPSHSRQLLDLGLERLAPRRMRLCKAWAQKTARDSRHKDLFTPTGAKPRLGKHIQTYRTPQTRTVSHYNSALPYLTRLLNGI